MPRSVLCAALALLGTLAAAPAQAAAACSVISTKAVGQDLGNGATAGKVVVPGLLQGLIAGSLTPAGFSYPVAIFIEVVTFTTANGTLTVRLEGGIDTTTGQFSATGRVVGANGKLSGATGFISVSGVAHFESGIFTEDIGGLICGDLVP